MLSFADRTSARALYSTGVAVTSGVGANATLATVTIPAGMLRTSSQLLIYGDFTSGGSVGTRTVTYTFTDGLTPTNVIVGNLNSAAGTRNMIRMVNRNSLSSQRWTLENTLNFSVATTVTSTTTLNTGAATTLTLTATNASDTLTMESLLVVVCP